MRDRDDANIALEGHAVGGIVIADVHRGVLAPEDRRRARLLRLFRSFENLAAPGQDRVAPGDEAARRAPPREAQHQPRLPENFERERRPVAVTPAPQARSAGLAFGVMKVLDQAGRRLQVAPRVPVDQVDVAGDRGGMGRAAAQHGAHRADQVHRVVERAEGRLDVGIGRLPRRAAGRRDFGRGAPAALEVALIFERVVLGRWRRVPITRPSPVALAMAS